jgi:hypothetical protein
LALVTEDGTGLSNAESYISVADADTRLGNLGQTNWATLQIAEKEAALRRSTAFIEQALRERWTGYRLHKTQALSWPRWYVVVDGYPVDPNTVPADVANACADLAMKAAAGDLNADLTPRVITKKVGPIETQYDRYSPQSVRYRALEMALSPYLKGSSSNAMLVRA